MELTKDGDKLISTIYGVYLKRKKSGVSKFEATSFDSDWMEIYFPNESKQDLSFAFMELKKAFGLKVYSDGAFFLSDTAIIYMENRFPDGVKQVFDYITKALGVLPAFLL